MYLPPLPPTPPVFTIPFRGSHSVYDPIHGGRYEFDPAPTPPPPPPCQHQQAPVEPVPGPWVSSGHELYDGMGNPIFGG